jgi:hypothetical protein
VNAAEAICGVGDSGHHPAQEHPAPPALHATRELTDGSDHVLDRVRRRELPLQLRWQTEALHGERVVEALVKRRRCAEVFAKSARKIRGRRLARLASAISIEKIGCYAPRMNRPIALLMVLGACTSAVPIDGTYDCVMTQERCGGGANFPPDNGGGPLVVTIAGNNVALLDSFACTGTWTGSQFGCTIQGVASCVTPTLQVPTLWTIVAAGTDPNDKQQTMSPLEPGQIWAGTDYPQGPATDYSLVCQRR